MALVTLGAGTHVQAQTVTMTLDTSAIAIGAPVSLWVHADRNLEAEQGAFIWPVIQDSLPGGLEILRPGQRDTTAVTAEDGANVIRISQQWFVTSWDSGFQAIPPISLLWNGDSIWSNPLLLQVILPPPGEAGVLAAHADIRRVHWTWQEQLRRWLPWALGIVLGIAVLIGIFRYLKRRPAKAAPEVKVPDAPLEPAHIVALRELERIQQAAVWKSGQAKAHHAAVSSTLRAYFEARYQFPAMERSTDEIRSGLAHLPILGAEKELVLEVLQLADLVKFAKFTPTADDHLRVVERSIRFVERTAMENPDRIA